MGLGNVTREKLIIRNHPAGSVNCKPFPKKLADWLFLTNWVNYGPNKRKKIENSIDI